VRDAVIYAAKNIFSFDLPGVAILIPDFIREITNIVLIVFLCYSKYMRERERERERENGKWVLVSLIVRLIY
jgi:hypothetical protein